MTKLRYVYDIETNGFMPTVDKIWMLVLTNVDTNEVKTYVSRSGNPNDACIHKGLKELSKADVIIGHNIIGYDNVVLKHLTGWEPLPHQRVIDTWILSLLNQYKRDHKHGLEGWGSKFSLPKLPFDKFDEYSDEMLTYCIRDVELNVKVYKVLVTEAQKLIAKNPLYKKGLDVEFEISADYNGTSYTTGFTDLSGSLTIDKDSNSADVINVAIETTGAVVIEITVNCPTANRLNIVEVVLTSNYQAGQSIGAQWRYTDGTFVGSLQSTPVTFATGVNPVVSRFNFYIRIPA